MNIKKLACFMGILFTFMLEKFSLGSLPSIMGSLPSINVKNSIERENDKLFFENFKKLSKDEQSKIIVAISDYQDNYYMDARESVAEDLENKLKKSSLIAETESLPWLCQLIFLIGSVCPEYRNEARKITNEQRKEQKIVEYTENQSGKVKNLSVKDKQTLIDVLNVTKQKLSIFYEESDRSGQELVNLINELRFNFESYGINLSLELFLIFPEFIDYLKQELKNDGLPLQSSHEFKRDTDDY